MWRSHIARLVIVGALCHAGPAIAADRTLILDVALTQDQFLCGQVVNRHGAPKAHAKVILISSTHVVGQSMTDDQGVFSMEVARGGLHMLSDGTTCVMIRVWTNRAAPPSAIKRILIVSDEDTVRAQVRNRRAEALILTSAGAVVIYDFVDDSVDSDDAS